MSSTATGNARQVGTTDKAGQQSALSQARKLLKGVTTEKAMRLFNRTANDNVKLDKFLSGVFKLPSAFNPETVIAMIKKLVMPHTLKNPHEHFGLIAIEEQRALLDVLVDEKVSEEVALKVAWLRGFKLSAEQEEAAALATQLYEKTLRTAIKSVSLWRQVYGSASTDTTSTVVQPAIQEQQPEVVNTTEGTINDEGEQSSVQE